MESLLQDLRYAVRTLLKSPGFTAIAVLTLTLGIGPTTAIFSVIDTLLLRPLPYPDADRIVTIWQTNPREGTQRDEVVPATFFDWRDRTTAFTAMAAVDPYAYSLITPDGRPEAVFALRVTEGFFEILGVTPYRGQLFAAEHHKPRGGNFTVITYALWQARFGGEPGIIGSSISLDGTPFVVLGVLPPDFELGLHTDVPGQRDVWVARQDEGWERQGLVHGTSGWWNVVARLKPGVSAEQAQADLDRVAHGLATEQPAKYSGVGAALAPLHDHLVSGTRTPLLILLSSVALVLLIACANVANLLLAQGSARERELAVRAALGASRGRLIRQLLTESLLLGLLGGACGVLFAFWGVDLIKALAPGGIPRMHAVAVDARILTFALIVSVTTAMLFGLAPASRAWRLASQGGLKGAQVSSVRARLRAGLIVGEIALALTLLIGAGLLLRSFGALLAVDPGFRKDGVVALQVFAWDRRDSVRHRVQFFEETERRIAALPGVVSVGAVTAGPFTAADIAMRRRLTILGRPAARPGEEAQVFVNHASPGYFHAIGIPVLRGRGFEPTDRVGTPYIAVINDAARRLSWASDDPIGSRLRLGDNPAAPVVEIVGVVGDARLRSLELEPRPEVYLAQRQTGWGSMTYYVRTRTDHAATLEAAKRAVWAVDPLQDFYQTATLEGLMSGALAPRRFSLVLLGAFAVLAIVLAAVGIYGVISFVVTRRTHEVGIRLALGAAPGNVVALIVRHGARLALFGLLLGVTGALLASRALASMLFRVPQWDVVTFAGAALALLGIALAAAYLPARRAAKVDPMVALRTD